MAPPERPNAPCPVEGCSFTHPHHHREDADWGEYVVPPPPDNVPCPGRCPKCRIASEARLRFWQAQR